MKLIPITELSDPELRDYTDLTDVALRRVLEPKGGLYLAESSKVIQRAITAGHTPRSVLLTEEWLEPLSATLEPFEDLHVFLGTPEQLEELTGFHMHRGAIASMHRPALPALNELLADASVIVVLENLVDHTNVGAVFRNIAGLGADGVIVTESCADPLYRRAVRVSMGTVLQIPWTRAHHWQETVDNLHAHDFEIAALALDDSAIDLADYAASLHEKPRKVALLLGSEGDGLSKRALASADVVVTIPMRHGVDSLNVANAAGIALWSIRGK